MKESLLYSYKCYAIDTLQIGAVDSPPRSPELTQFYIIISFSTVTYYLFGKMTAKTFLFITFSWTVLADLKQRFVGIRLRTNVYLKCIGHEAIN